MFVALLKKNVRQSQIILMLGFFLASIFLLPEHVFAAADTLQNLNAVQANSGLGSSSLGSIIGKIIHVFLGTLGIIALCIIIYAGFIWMTAGGSEEKIEEAKKMLRNAAIGLIIILMSYALTQFIMDKIGTATGFTPGGTVNVGGGSGGGLLGFDGASPLGKVIEFHDPGRGAQNVPRNKSITVQFKMPIEPASVIDASSPKTKKVKFKDEAGKDIDLIVSGPMKKDAFSLYATTDGKKSSLTSDEIIVFMGGNGSDLNTVIFNPVPFLGSASKHVDYTAEISSSISRYGTNTSVFTGFSAGYSWKFDVGTDLDLTPPRIESVIPVAGGTFDRNITVQITMNEPVNLASAVGTYNPAKSYLFDNITARDSTGKIISGEWRAGSGFNVIEFTPLEQCSTNSCGQKIFCLPPKEVITVRAKSGKLLKVGDPQVDPSNGYFGVADTADNALDGGGENAVKPWSLNKGAAQGSDVDDFFMSFKTTEAVKSTAPRVSEVDPIPNTSSKNDPTFNSSSSVSVIFDSLMKVTTLGDIVMNAKLPKAQAGYSKLSEHVTQKNGTDLVDVTKVNIEHVPFAKSQSYATLIPSSVQDIYQNCFLPSGGKNLKQGIACDFPAIPPGQIPTNHYCCNGIISDESCTLLQYGASATK